MSEFDVSEDKIETLLLLFLERNICGRKGPSLTATLGSGRESGVWEAVDASDALLQRYVAAPSCAFLPVGGDRLYSFDYRDLTGKPWEILGRRTEVVVPKWERNEVWWTCMQQITRAPEGVATWGRAAAWYVRHVCIADPSAGWISHRRRVVPFSATGAPMPVRYAGVRAEDGASNDGAFAVGDCSIIEDTLRARSVRADVRAECGLTFALDYDAYQDFFRLRDGPRETPTGRRNPIVHWVGRHLRRMRNGKTIPIQAHCRGTESVDMGGISATLTLQSNSYPWVAKARA